MPGALPSHATQGHATQEGPNSGSAKGGRRRPLCHAAHGLRAQEKPARARPLPRHCQSTGPPAAFSGRPTWAARDRFGLTISLSPVPMRGGLQAGPAPQGPRGPARRKSANETVTGPKPPEPTGVWRTATQKLRCHHPRFCLKSGMKRGTRGNETKAATAPGRTTRGSLCKDQATLLFVSGTGWFLSCGTTPKRSRMLPPCMRVTKQVAGPNRTC